MRVFAVHRVAQYVCDFCFLVIVLRHLVLNSGSFVSAGNWNLSKLNLSFFLSFM